MYAISEYVTWVAVTFTLSAFLFALCVLLFAIEQSIDKRWRMPRIFQKAGALSWTRPATVVARHERFGR